jgi:HK97 family phage portal protein
MGVGKLLTRNVRPASDTQVRQAGEMFQMIIDGTPQNFPTTLFRGGLSLPGAWRATLKISDAIGSVPWHLWREDENGKPIEKLPRPLLLQQPAPPDERMTTFSSWGMDLVWHGNAIGVWAAWENGIPTAVLPIPAEQVGVRRIGWEAMSGLPTGAIKYQIAGMEFDPWQIMHVKGPCRPSDVRGFGVLEAHLSGLTGKYAGTLDLAKDLQQQAQSVSQHGVPTGYLKSDNPDLNQTEADDLKAKWLAGQADARTVAVLNATTSFEPLAWNPDEMQLVEARKMSLLEQALVFGMQPSDLGVETSNRTYRNDNAEDVKFVKWGLRGHISRFQAALSAVFPPGQCVIADLDDYTLPDPLERAQAAQVRLQSKQTTQNEERALEGRAPVDGGDEFAKDPAPADPAPEPNQEGDPADGDPNQEDQ